MVELNFRFDAATHTYHLNGNRIPGFSEIREAMGIGESFKPKNLQDYLDEGTALHSWFHFLCQGLTSVDEPDPRIAGRVEGIRKFLAETDYKMIGGEEPIHCRVPLFACTPDSWGIMNGRQVLIELKRSAKAKWHPLQTAAQAMALRERGFRAQDRFGLYLRDGDYKLELHIEQSDFARWSAIVNGFHARGWYI